MAASDLTLKLILLGEDKSAGKSLSGVGKAAGVAFAVAGAAALKFGADSISAFMDADREQAKLQDAYARFPKLADVNISALRALNEEIQRKVGADADEIAGAQAVLAQYELTGSQLKQMTPLLVDYATKTGKDLPTAAGLLGKALMGNARAMKDLGIDFKATGDRVRISNSIVSSLDEKVGGYADSIPEAEKKQKILAASFEDLQETVGEKLLPVLVSLVDAGQAVVDWAGENEGVLIPLGQAAGTAAAGIALVVGATKGVQAAKGVKDTIKGISESYNSLSTKSKAAAIGVGAATIALTVGVAIVASYWMEKQKAEQAVADFTTAIQADTGALGENTRAAIINQLTSQGLAATAAKMGISVEAVADAMLNNAEALEYVNGKMAEYQQANAATSNRHTGMVSEVSDLSGAMRQMGQQIETAQSNYRDYTSAVGSATKATTDNTDVTDDNADSQKELADSLADVYRQTLALRGDTRALEAAYDDAAEAVKKNGRTLDTNTNAGRRNQAALDNIASTALTVKAGMEKAGKSTSEVDRQMDKARAEFIKTAKQMGVSADEAKKLADRLGLVKSKKVDVTVNVRKTGISNIQAIPGKGHKLFTMRAYAGGGRPKVGELAMFHADELWVPDTAGTVLTKSRTQQLIGSGPSPIAAGGGTTIVNQYTNEITIQGVVDGDAAVRALEPALVKAMRDRGVSPATGRGLAFL